MSDKHTRPDDPVMAQKAAIDANIPYEAPDAGAPADAPMEPILTGEATVVPEGTPLAPRPLTDAAHPAEVTQASAPATIDPAVMETLTRMQREIDQLRAGQVTQAQEDGDTGPGGYPWQYYKRREDGGPMSGWVTIGPGGAVPSGPRRGRHDSGSRQTYVAKGMRLITDCGVAPIPSDRAQVRRPGDEFITLLSNGGARYVPAAQVVALKWHISPPVPGVIFPEYEKVKATVKLFACDDCEYESYFLPEDHYTIRGCFTHLRQAHQYRREEAALALQAQGIEYRGGRFAVEAAGLAAGVGQHLTPVPEGFEAYAGAMKAPVD